MIYLYGSAHPGNTRTIRVTPGSRRIEIPVITGFIDLSNCCDPGASAHHLNAGMMATYKAAFRCPDDVPAGIVLGCLQYLGVDYRAPRR